MLILPEINNKFNIESQILKIVKNDSNYKNYDDTKYKDLIEFINAEAKKCNIEITNVFDKQNDLAKKILEKFKNHNDIKIKNFFKELLPQISVKFPQYFTDINKLDSNIFEAQIDKFYKNFHKELIYSRKDFKNEIDYLKIVGNSYYERFKTEAGEVNLNGINSKTIESQFKEYTKLLSILKNDLLSIQEKIKTLQEAQLVLSALSATFGITAGVLAIASFFCPPLATLSSLFSMSTIVCGIISSILKSRVHSLNLKVLKIINNIKNLEKFNFQWFGIAEYIEFAALTFSGIKELISMNWPKKFFDNNIPNPVSSFISAAIDISSIVESVEQIRKTIENQKNIYKKTIEINNYLKNIESIKWSVVDETPQTAPYEEGGTGGKNLKYKNLKTQEIFTLEELLSYSKIKLNLLGLTKVYNSSLKEWYIKTLPNKILIDNLG